MITPFLLLGIALGPHGLRIFSPQVLAFIDPAVPVALGGIGVLVGLSAGTRRGGDIRLSISVVIEMAFTAVLMIIGLAAIVPLIDAAGQVPGWQLSVLAAMCAATSLALTTGSPAAPGDHAGRVVELDGLLAIVVGGLLLAGMREPSVAAGASLFVQACSAVIVLAVATWVLLSRASSDTEERVFTIAALLLIGGSADFLSLSALLGGLLAGILWQQLGGQARESIRRDVTYVQHPLLVLLLVIAGSNARLTPEGMALGLVYALLRANARLGGGWLAARSVGLDPMHQVGTALLPPGILGVAFALNAVREFGPDFSILLTAVVIGTVASDLIASVVPHREVVLA